MFADHLAVSGHEFACSIGERLAPFRQVGVEKLLVVASRNEADLLRIRLRGQSQPVMPRQIANLWLGPFPERKEGTTELILGQTKQEIGLVLGGIRRTLEQPAATVLIKLNPRVMPRRQRVRADLLRDDQELIKLQVVVAETARDGGASGQILFDERLHHITLEAVFVINHVVRDAKSLRHSASIVNI